MPKDEKTEEPKAYTEEEMMALLLQDFQDPADEGRDAYLDDVIKKMRKDLE